MKLTTSYDDHMPNSNATALACPADENMTQQQFRDEADINTIVRRFGLTGELPADQRAPIFGDFTNVTDFQTAMNAVRKAQEGFDDLPANLRARFNNDPQRMLEFVEDNNNRDEALKLGIIAPPPEKTRDAVAAIDELTATLKPKGTA
ncbi:MAG: internal scaffolding protein [Microvirus sp.]|nr:MAG: internal scaffolding protein [Microvirus sp.]